MVRARTFCSPLFKKFPLALYLYEESLRKYFSVLPNKGVRVVDRTWDYLIILDACRFDYFKRHNTLNGDLDGMENAFWVSVVGVLGGLGLERAWSFETPAQTGP